MSLIEKISSDLKEAMKSGNSEKLSLLRGIMSEFHNKEIEKKAKGSGEFNDEDALQILQKESKKRKESADMFRQGGRNDLAEKEEAEAKEIQVYLPEQMSREEIEKFVDSLSEKGISDFNSAIKEVMKELKGKADGKEVSEIVRNKFGA